MKYFVNDNCIGCGMCADRCPEAFEMTSEGIAKALKNEIEPQLKETTQEAMDSCPVGAIEPVE